MIQPMLDDLRLGAERNYDESRQTPFMFFEPIVRDALDLMSPEQRRRLRGSAAWTKAIEGIDEMNR